MNSLHVLKERYVSCLQPKRKDSVDLTGVRFNRLLVKEFAGMRKGKNTWKCLCDCGREKLVWSNNLRNRNTQSCGCLAKDRTAKSLRFDPGVNNFNSLLYNYKRSATRRGHNWVLTEQECAVLFKMDCHYCGRPPTRARHEPRSYGAYIYNGIDRLDNDIGYTLSNTVPCCYTCNHAKHTMHASQFISMAQKIAERHPQLEELRTA